MYTLTITLLLLSSILRSVLAAPALTDPKTNFSLSAVRKKVDPERLRKRRIESITSDFKSPAYGYTSPVSVGGQVLNLNLDMGSTALWVYSTLMPSAKLEGHNSHNPSLSGLSIDLQIPFKRRYADNARVSGTWFQYRVSLGDFAVYDQTFGAARYVSKKMLEEPDDGMLGLQFIVEVPSVNEPSFLSNILGQLDDPQFTVYLPYQRDGAFDFGAINLDRFIGDIQYSPFVPGTTRWRFDSQAYKVGDKQYDSPGVIGIADTGSTHINLQVNQVKKYCKSVTGSKFDKKLDAWIYPCLQPLTSISFLVGPIIFATIPGTNLVTGESFGNGKWCLGGIQETDKNLNIYGLPFFNTYYIVFDFSVPPLGFADIKAPLGLVQKNSSEQIREGSKKA